MLSAAEFSHLCRLARLEPEASAQAALAAQCSDIIAYMAKLAEVDTTGVEPLYSPLGMENPDDPALCAGREDAACRRLPREAVLAGAPETDGAFFIVPRIVEGK